MGRRDSRATALLLCALLTSATPVGAKDANTLASARALMKDGRYQDAFNLFEKSGGDKFDGADGQLARIYCIMMLGHYRLAAEECTKVLDKNPKNWQMRLFRAEAYEKLGEHQLAGQDKELLPEYAQHDTKERKHEFHKARDAVKHEKYSTALDEYCRFLKAHPTDTQAYYERAKTYRALKQLDKAILDYNQVIKLEPARTKVYWERGLALKDMKKYDDALKDFSHFIDLHPAYDSALYQRAETYRQIKQYKNAIGDYTAILCFQSEDDEALRNRAECYLADGQYEKAAADFTKAIDLGPMEAARFYAGRATAYDKLGKHKLAEEDRRKAKELAGEN